MKDKKIKKFTFSLDFSKRMYYIIIMKSRETNNQIQTPGSTTMKTLTITTNNDLKITLETKSFKEIKKFFDFFNAEYTITSWKISGDRIMTLSGKNQQNFNLDWEFFMLHLEG